MSLSCRQGCMPFAVWKIENNITRMVDIMMWARDGVTAGITWRGLYREDNTVHPAADTKHLQIC